MVQLGLISLGYMPYSLALSALICTDICTHSLTQVIHLVYNLFISILVMVYHILNT